MTNFWEQGAEYDEQTAGRGDGLTRVYWMNGEPRDKTPGRFWVAQNRIVDQGIELGEPWKVQSHTFRGGDTNDLYFASALYLAPICWKQQNYKGDGQGGVAEWIEGRKFSKLEAGESIAYEMLCLMQGFGSQPVVLSTKGTKTSMAFAAKILPDFKKLRDAVKKARSGAVVPPWWFWLAIRSERDAKGGIVYEKTKGTQVTPPIWVMPENLEDREVWTKLYVGNELAAIGQQVYSEIGKEWAQRPISDGYAPREDAAAVGVENRNVPKPIESDDDMPF